MRWTEQVIVAHKNRLAQRPADQRAGLIAHWEQYRNDRVSDSAIEMALDLAVDGNSNEVELAFYVLMDLALNDASLQRHLGELTKHKSATVRRNLAFFFSPELPSEFSSVVFTELLRDKAASVRIEAIETIGMHDWKTMLPRLHDLRSHEPNQKVNQTLDYWILLLETGYRVDRSPVPGRFEVTVLTGHGTASKSVEARSPADSRIHAAVEELRRLP